MRLIDADAFASDFMDCADFEFSGKEVANFVNHEPTVDAVPVVRCKDCKHYEDHKLKIFENCVRGGRCIPMKPYDFCSNGERRSGDEHK